ncbi:hypothetical protein [Nostoc sp. ChiSLP03a]|nr:hypothetical protein [Nostoc sp. ChiSLP03a]MDZ8216253.1 hypothetical protein [Nostoc sp. ChiSLP03a]
MIRTIRLALQIRLGAKKLMWRSQFYSTQVRSRESLGSWLQLN